jgi:hypothetical protein
MVRFYSNSSKKSCWSPANKSIKSAGCRRYAHLLLTTQQLLSTDSLHHQIFNVLLWSGEPDCVGSFLTIQLLLGSNDNDDVADKPLR